MARKPRFSLPGVPQHIIQRGNDRKPCFFVHGDYRLYLDYLAEAAERFECQVHAYVLMTNHVHLLVTPLGENGIAHMMQRLGQRYVQSINATYHRSGTLWEGRYKASLVDSENYLLACMRYIELNPVRAAMVKHPAEYRWSSYRANAQQEADDLVVAHELYHRLGETSATRCEAYRSIFKTHVDDAVIDEIRGALNQELVLGSSRFRQNIEAMIGRQASPRPRGRPAKRNSVGVY